MNDKPKTWTDVWFEFKSPEYWWTICLTLLFCTILSAINKYIVHIPTFPKW